MRKSVCIDVMICPSVQMLFTIELAVAFYSLAADQREEQMIHAPTVRTEVEKWSEERKLKYNN